MSMLLIDYGRDWIHSCVRPGYVRPVDSVCPVIGGLHASTMANTGGCSLVIFWPVRVEMCGGRFLVRPGSQLPITWYM